MNHDNLFNSMVKEAMAEVANHGWQKASQNAVTLAAFGMLAERIEGKINGIVVPAWMIGGSVIASVIWLIVSKCLGLGG